MICYECLDYLNSRRIRQLTVHGGPKPLQAYDPVFKVLDIQRAMDHYERLGFTTEYNAEGFAFAKWANLTIQLERDEHPEAHTTSTLYIHVDDADELAADWRKAGLQVADPKNKGLRQTRRTTRRPRRQRHQVRRTTEVDAAWIDVR